MTASAMWWISVGFWLFWCYSWVLAYRRQRLIFWAFWNTVMGVIVWASLFMRVAGSAWVFILWYLSLLVVPCWWLFQVVRGPAAPAVPADDYSDLQPLTDEHGNLRGPR